MCTRRKNAIPVGTVACCLRPVQQPWKAYSDVKVLLDFLPHVLINSAPVQWSGLLFDGGTGHLQYTTVRYTGDANSLNKNYPAILAYNVSSSQVLIEDSQVVDNRMGLWVLDSHVTVSNTLFSGHNDAATYPPLRIEGATTVVTLTANTFTNNIRNRVLLMPGAMMAADATLVPQTVLDGYELENDFTVPAGITLTVEPGVTVTADRGRELKVQGYLEALGTPAQPITFTSVADTGAQQWTGLAFDGGTGYLKHATVRYGGDGNSLGVEPAGIVARNVTAGEVRLEHTWLNTACGFVAQDSHMSIISSTISGNGGTACANSRGMHLKRSGTVFTMTHSLFQNNSGQILFWLGDARATFDHNRFIDNGENQDPTADFYVLDVSSASPVITLTNNLLQGNAGGLSFSGEGRATLVNNAFIGQTGHAFSNGSALFIAGNLTAIHNTFAHNRGMACDPNWCKGEAIWISSEAWPEDHRVVFTNTVIADHKTGVWIYDGGVRMVNTLWYSNTTNLIEGSEYGGVLTETGHLEGPAAFATDGYHLTCDSVALEAGVDAGIAGDIDGEPRPQPGGTMPDLGADESPCVVEPEFTAMKTALPPQWIVDPNPGAPAGFSGRLRQRYLVNYHYLSSSTPKPELQVAITDTLPAELAFEAEAHQPAMDFQRQGQQLTWGTQSAVATGEFGWMRLDGVDEDPQVGTTMTNTAELQAGVRHFDLEATTAVPLFPPLLTAPWSGETCYGGNPVRGLAQPNVAIQILYADNTVISETVADAGGVFSTTYFYPSDQPRTIKARACAGGQCSADSNKVTLTPAQSFWCPQRTRWRVGDLSFGFRSRSSGNLSSQDFSVPTVRPAETTTTSFDVYVSTHPPAATGVLRTGGVECPYVWVTLNGEGAFAIHKDQIDDWNIWWEFSHVVKGMQNPRIVCLGCDWGTYEEQTCGRRLIDSDGYVFDVTQGLEVLTTTLPGITVTCMISMPDWGGWVPWPAHFYDQVNPQVTGNDGYFAFFTPPGHYYLDVEGIPGFQSWRSPAVEVISDIVHVNVPLTPWEGGEVHTVTLTPEGIVPPIVTVPVGSIVEWVSELTGDDILADLVRYGDNPILQPLSHLDPISHTLGWDGGLMEPGRVYRRQFVRPGTYTYSDGAGYTGSVVVEPHGVYLPVVVRNPP